MSIPINSPSLQNIFDGKTVALIGNARTLRNNPNHGQFIDDFDVVVRMNAFRIIPGLTGNKTTIIANSFCDIPNNPNENDYMFRRFSESHCKNALFTMPFVYQGNQIHPEISRLFAYDEIESNTRRMLDYAKKFGFTPYCVTQDVFKEFYSKMECKPSTGLTALWLILHFNIKKLYIAGYSFDTSCAGHYWDETPNQFTHLPDREYALIRPYLQAKLDLILLDRWLMQKFGKDLQTGTVTI